MKIGELAREAGVGRDAVRHYVELGLLAADRNPANGYQIFDATALARLRFIATARKLGLRLDDVQAIFADADRSKSPCPRVRELLEARIHETRERIAELQALCERMESAVAEWRQMPDSEPTGDSVCRLIESQDTGSAPASETHRNERNR